MRRSTPLVQNEHENNNEELSLMGSAEKIGALSKRKNSLRCFNKKHVCWFLILAASSMVPLMRMCVVGDLSGDKPQMKQSPESNLGAKETTNRLFRQQAPTARSMTRAIHPIPVLLFPTPSKANEKHIQLNGVEESPFLRTVSLTTEDDSDFVWVASMTSHSCQELVEAIERMQESRLKANQPTWKGNLRMVDYGDSPKENRCRDVESLIGQSRVSYHKRSIVARRHWDSNIQWISPGSLASYAVPKENHEVSIRHSPFSVRTDTISSLDGILRLRGQTLADAIESWVNRSVDVSHFWPIDPGASRRKGLGVLFVRSSLRGHVSQLLSDWGTESKQNLFVGVQGQGGKPGRNQVASSYVTALLNSKIVVVTQRDTWEDHWRLLEAMSCGSLVMSDLMIAPPHALRNGTNVLFFSSSRELKSLLGYYLRHPNEAQAIARRGRRVAMLHHRSWHRMEEIVFGEVKSTCHPSNPSCPWTVHASPLRQAEHVSQ